MFFLMVNTKLFSKANFIFISLTTQENLNEHADTGKSVEIYNLVSSCTLDIILRCAFSYTTDCQSKRYVAQWLKTHWYMFLFVCFFFFLHRRGICCWNVRVRFMMFKRSNYLIIPKNLNFTFSKEFNFLKD